MQTIFNTIKGIFYVLVGLVVFCVVLGLLAVLGAIGAFLATFGWLIVGGIVFLVFIIYGIREAFSSSRS